MPTKEIGARPTRPAEAKHLVAGEGGAFAPFSGPRTMMEKLARFQRRAGLMTKGATPSDKVYNFILDKILSREWPVKCRIMTEGELCAHNQVSRIAVREAVERLCALGLLAKKRGVGTFVSDPAVDACLSPLISMMILTEQDIQHILHFRRSFECGNIELFMQNCGRAEIDALKRNYQDMVEQYAEEPECGGLLDFEFHQLIALGTGNPFIAKIADILVEVMSSHQTLLYMELTHENAIIYHKKILDAIEMGDTEVAILYMRRHINIAIERYKLHTHEQTLAAGNQGEVTGFHKGKGEVVK